MSLLARSELPPDYPPFQAFREKLGFVPSIFPAQSLLPRAIEAQAHLLRALLLAPGALPWPKKEEILLAAAAARGNVYCVSVHGHVLRSLGCEDEDIEAIAARRFDGFEENRAALLALSVRLTLSPHSVAAPEFERLRGLSITDEDILEAVQIAALAQMLCTLSTGLAVETEFPLPPGLAAIERSERGAASEAVPAPRTGAYLRAADLGGDFAPFAFLKSRLGFVPALFRAQTLRPDAVDAEVAALRDILLTEDVLSRRQKEFVHLVVSAANLDAYGVAVHTEILRGLGVAPEVSDAVVADHRRAEVSEGEKALLDFAAKLAARPEDYGESDVQQLRAGGFSDAQILEAIVMTSLSVFLNTLSAGLGPKPDFRPRHDLAAERAAAAKRRAEAADDPDAPLVASAKGGDVAAFEGLVRRHQARIYRTLVGLTGSAEDAEDCCQSAFVKAFRKIGDFAGASRFSTWLTRIALNEGLERLRRTHPTESLEEPAGGEEEFRPSLVAAWVEDPERLYAREEMRRLVRGELARLPIRYRAAVMLRDIEQLSTAEAAAVLDLPIPTLKTRLLRGRLMMREALAAHFAAGPGVRSV